MHLTWPPLLPVSLKLFAARALQDGCSTVSAVQGNAATRTVVDDLLNQANASAPKNQRWAPPPVASITLPPLEGYFSRVEAAYNASISAGSLSAEAAHVSAILLNACRQRVCSECVAATGRPACTWTAETEVADLRNLSEAAHCLEPAKELFNDCKWLAHHAYEELAGVRREWPTLHFQTALALTVNPQTQLAIAGKAGEISPGHRYIRSEFKPDALSLGDYFALAYILAHECVVHGFCGAQLADEVSNRSIAFHDGWMDRIALKLLAWIPTADSKRLISRYSSDFVAQGEKVRVRRNDIFDRNPSVSAEAYDKGTRALQVFAELVGTALTGDDLDGPQPNPGAVDHAVIVASLRINSSALTHLERRDLVDALVAAFDFGAREKRLLAYASPRGREVISHVHSYFGDLDAPRLVRAVVATLTE